MKMMNLCLRKKKLKNHIDEIIEQGKWDIDIFRGTNFRAYRTFKYLTM